MTEVFIGFGSNVGDAHRLFHSALAALSDTFSKLQLSPLYHSKAIGPTQPDYTNAVAGGLTALSPQDLLNTLHEIETAHGRERGERWGPRTLDLDLLLYGEKTLSSSTLTLPHPELSKRNFVLAPLVDLRPKLRLPNGVSLASLLSSIGHEGLTPLGPLT